MLDAEQWAELKRTYRGLNLHMPCCGVGAIPKTSTLGNYFFAHARRGECATAPESAEHLYCKTLIARAAVEAGWTVTTERPGVSPDGEEWVADVFCEKETGQFALEVQLSPQTDEETIRRQLRYKASGVRGAWFFGARARREPQPLGRSTPTFTMRPFPIGGLPVMEHFGRTLPELVVALLQNRIFWDGPKLSRPHLVEFLEDVCRECNAPVKQVLAHKHGGSAKGPELTPWDFHAWPGSQPTHTVAGLAHQLEEAQADISNHELAAQGLNLIGLREVIDGEHTRYPYCNLCLHCRAPQSNFRLLERLCSGTREPEVTTIPRQVDGPGRWVLREPVGG